MLVTILCLPNRDAIDCLDARDNFASLIIPFVHTVTLAPFLYHIRPLVNANARSATGCSMYIVILSRKLTVVTLKSSALFSSAGSCSKTPTMFCMRFIIDRRNKWPCVCVYYSRAYFAAFFLALALFVSRLRNRDESVTSQEKEILVHFSSSSTRFSLFAESQFCPFEWKISSNRVFRVNSYYFLGKRYTEKKSW